MPVLILMAKEVFQTKTTQHIPRLPSGDPFSRLAPVHNPALAVAHVNAVT
jgi:hypothetical protein